MQKYDWTHLNALQIGKYAEYFVKMEFTRHGFDVYSSEVDDRGIDFVIRCTATRYYDVQVKSVRDLNYVFFIKAKFELRDNLLAAIVLFDTEREPVLYLVPARVWEHPNPLFRNREYGGKKSAPEWGLNLSHKNLSLLEPYRFETMVNSL